MSRSVRLHARDVEVLELLADRRVETLSLLHQKLWPGCSRKTAYNRLGQLAKAGYLEHLVRPDPLPRRSDDRRPLQHLYALGPKAPAAMRIRNRDTRKIAATKLPASFIDHQLATNRVGDWLGTRLMGEREASAGLKSRQRPDAAYRTAKADDGRQLMLIEVDLGHYSEARILAKVDGFRKHRDARGMLFACPTVERAVTIASWIEKQHGSGFMRRCQIFTFEELKQGSRLVSGTEPIQPRRHETTDWYADFLGDPGCR